MLFAQFYTLSTGYITGTVPPRFAEPQLIEAVGDRAVVILDARLGKEKLGQIAAQECERRGFAAWRVFRGERFTEAKPISQLWSVARAKPGR